MDWPEAVRKGEVWAAGLNAIAIGVLWFTRRWWRVGGGHAAPPAARRRPWWQEAVFFAGLAAIVVLAGTLRWTVASQSLWWDEVWQARNASVGDWKPDKRNPGELKFVPTTWAQALWNYRKPTNHPPMAVASKACHEVWRRATGAKPGEFNEFVLRLPGFVASLVAVAMIALLLRAWGLPGGGLVAALFLAIHTWHIRYGIDGRGYTFLVPLTILGMWAVWRACGPGARGTGQGHHVRSSQLWWWVFGITQGLILWCHLLSVWVCAGLAAAGLWWIWRENAGEVRRRKLARFVAVQAVGGMLFLQLFAPNLMQAATWGEKNQDGRVLDGPYLLTTLTEIACGWEAWPRPSTPFFRDLLAPFDLEQFIRECTAWDNYGLPRIALGILVPFVLVGLVLAWMRRRDLFVAIASVLTSCALFLAFVALTGFYFYHRFVLAVIVPVALLVGAAIGVGGALLGRMFCRAQAGVRVGVTIATAVGLVLPWAYWNQITRLHGFLERRPCTPLRETAAALRTARDEGAAVFGYGFGAEALQYYLPDLRYERDSPARPALETALREAQAAGKPLFVAVGYEELNRQNLPDGFVLLDDSAVFEQDSARGGWEPQFAYRILSAVLGTEGTKGTKGTEGTKATKAQDK